MTIGTLILGLSVAAAAQTAQAPISKPTPLQAPVVVTGRDANAVRAKLRVVLQEYSPELGQALALDPTLLTDANYLAPYPRLVAFLAQHPEVTRNPSYYFDRAQRMAVQPRDPRVALVGQWRG